MDFRKIFDTIPDEFDRWRPRYCTELFDDLIEYAQLAPGKTALEVGPGTGQATEPVLKSGCDYTAIELGENFTEFITDKFGTCDNFSIINADFETYDFGGRKFDLLYSAAAFQWIPEKIGYPKAYDLLKPGGSFAMFLLKADVQPGGGYTEEKLYNKIQAVYNEFFHPEIPYTCDLDYDAREKYGFTQLETREYKKSRTFTADEYVRLIGTHSDHLTLKEPYRTGVFEGIRAAINECGGSIARYDLYTMYLAKK